MRRTTSTCRCRRCSGTGGQDAADRLRAVGKFGRFFSRELFDTYGGVLVRLGRYDVVNPRKKRTLRAPEPEIHLVKTTDDKILKLTRYRGGHKGPVVLSHGLGVSSLIFSIDTIETNLLEYLIAAGYDCWMLDYRASIDLPYARELWTGDDVATKDYPAAVGKVRALTGAPTVQVLAHCFGATTFSMAMLAGLEGVRSAVISQISTDYIVPWFPQRLLAYMRAPALFELMGIDVIDARATTADNWRERALDKALQLIVPVPRKERTHDATSNRISALYGRLYQLDQLNNATVSSGLAEMFGEANIEAFRQLALFARRRHIVDRDGHDAYLPHAQRLALPITFIHGAEECVLQAGEHRAYARAAVGGEWQAALRAPRHSRLRAHRLHLRQERRGRRVPAHRRASRQDGSDLTEAGARSPASVVGGDGACRTSCISERNCSPGMWMRLRWSPPSKYTSGCLSRLSSISASTA